ncbi:hypothetical protein [Celeribacter persicus]|uniref:hypothetical protein n=1 Tax=Celeribacter persicus TaxID=1651082 RepID=UPI000D307B26|nr:hypothetical protein [Celeribacter persicus]
MQHGGLDRDERDDEVRDDADHLALMPATDCIWTAPETSMAKKKAAIIRRGARASSRPATSFCWLPPESDAIGRSGEGVRTLWRSISTSAKTRRCFCDRFRGEPLKGAPSTNPMEALSISDIPSATPVT